MTGTLKTRMGFLIRGSGCIMAWAMAFLGRRLVEARADHPELQRLRRMPVITGVYATLSRNASSAAPTASGVPTCIQTPSSRRPNSRSCSLARSNILVSENSPVRRVGEQRRRHDRGAGIDERHHLMFPALAQRAIGQHGVVAAAAIADAAGGRRHQQQDIHARGIEGLRQPRQIGPHAVDPHACRH